MSWANFKWSVGLRWLEKRWCCWQIWTLLFSFCVILCKSFSFLGLISPLWVTGRSCHLWQAAHAKRPPASALILQKHYYRRSGGCAHHVFSSTRDKQGREKWNPRRWLRRRDGQGPTWRALKSQGSCPIILLSVAWEATQKGSYYIWLVVNPASLSKEVNWTKGQQSSRRKKSTSTSPAELRGLGFWSLAAVSHA